MTNIDGSMIKIIKEVQKILLFDKTGVWVKSDDNPLSDVVMGRFDVCELVSCQFISRKNEKKSIAKNIKGLSVLIKTKLADTDFLDVTFILSLGKHYQTITHDS